MTKKKIRRSTLNRKQRTLQRKEERIRQIMIWSAISLAVVVVGILAFGIVQEYIIKPRTVVARVDDVEITAKEYQSRVYYQRDILRTQMLQYQAYLAQIDPSQAEADFQVQQLQQQVTQLKSQLAPEMKDSIGKSILDQMAEEQILLHEAEARDITVEAEEIDRRLEEMLGFDREAAATAPVTETQTLTETTAPSPTPMTEAQFQENYENFVKNYLSEAGLTEQDFRRILKTDVIREQLFPVITEDVETEEEQVKVTYVAAGSEEEAEILRERLQEEDPAELLAELQGNEDDATIGRELAWYPMEYLASILGPGLEVLAFETPVGEITEPVPGQDGRYYVLKIEGREVRPLDEYLLQQKQQTAFNTWLQEQREERVQYLEWEKFTPAQP